MKYFSSYIYCLSLAASSATALVVATGNHIDGNLNWSVAWKEGSSPCNEGVASLLAPIEANPCEHNLAADGKLYHLAYCGTDDFGLYNSITGARIGPCKRVPDKKISCDAGYVHDYVKHWLCGDV
ncbi:hypothetical protein BJX62DRAFT_244938 [Aspergillus germanicus]